MNGYFFQCGIVLFQLDALGCILFVLGGDVSACTGEAGSFVLGTFENHLNPISFLCHADVD